MSNYQTQDMEPDYDSYANDQIDFYTHMSNEKWIDRSAETLPPWFNDVEENTTNDPTNPSHYTSVPREYEHHRVMAVWGMDYHLSAAIKYLARAGKKTSAHLSDKEKEMEDLKKAITYISMRLELMEENIL